MGEAKMQCTRRQLPFNNMSDNAIYLLQARADIEQCMCKIDAIEKRLLDDLDVTLDDPEWVWEYIHNKTDKEDRYNKLIIERLIEQNIITKEDSKALS